MTYRVIKSASRITVFTGSLKECEDYINSCDEYEQKYLEIAGIY